MPPARTVLAAAVVAPWIAWAVVRSLGLDSAHPLVAAMAFTPYAAVTAVVPVLTALALRARAVAGVAVLALVALLAAVLPRALGSERVPAGADGPILRVMSANVLYGSADMRAVLELAVRQNVDVISFQELTLQALARFDAAGGARRFPGRAVEPREGASGSGLLSRRAFTAQSADDATAAEQPEAQLRIPGAPPVRVKAVHPRPPISAHSEPEWSAAVARLPRPGREGTGPLRLLFGDFNATLDHRALRDLLDDGYVDAAEATGNGLRPTWSSGWSGPPITIDHVLLDARLGVRGYSVHAIPGSDHRAVVAELVLPGG